MRRGHPAHRGTSWSTWDTRRAHHRRDIPSAGAPGGPNRRPVSPQPRSGSRSAEGIRRIEARTGPRGTHDVRTHRRDDPVSGLAWRTELPAGLTAAQMFGLSIRRCAPRASGASRHELSTWDTRGAHPSQRRSRRLTSTPQTRHPDSPVTSCGGAPSGSATHGCCASAELGAPVSHSSRVSSLHARGGGIHATPTILCSTWNVRCAPAAPEASIRAEETGDGPTTTDPTAGSERRLASTFESHRGC